MPNYHHKDLEGYLECFSKEAEAVKRMMLIVDDVMFRGQHRVVSSKELFDVTTELRYSVNEAYRKKNDIGKDLTFLDLGPNPLVEQLRCCIKEEFEKLNANKENTDV